MKITERRLRSLIRNIIKESLINKELTLDVLRQANIITAKETRDIKSKITGDLEESAGTAGKVAGVIAAAILATTVWLDISKNMKIRQAEEAAQEKIDMKGINLALQFKLDMQGAYDKWKVIDRKADAGDPTAIYYRDMIWNSLNACTSGEVQHSRDVMMRHGPQQDNNPTNTLYKGQIYHDIERIPFENHPDFKNKSPQEIREIIMLCHRFSDATAFPGTYNANNPNSFTF